MIVYFVNVYWPKKNCYHNHFNTNLNKGSLCYFGKIFYELSYCIDESYRAVIMISTQSHSKILLFHQDLCLPILFFLILFFLIMTRALNNSDLFFGFFTTQRNDKIKAILGESDFITIYLGFFPWKEIEIISPCRLNK